MSQPSNPHGHAPDLEPPLEAAVWSVLREPLDADAIARVTARAEAVFPDDLPEPPARSTRPLNLFLSRSLILKSLSAVAAVIVVVGATFLLQPTSSAFGEVIRQLRSTRSLSYVTRIYIEGSTKPIESKVQIAKDGRQRQEMAGGTVTIMDASSQIRLTLLKDSKRALVPAPTEQPATRLVKNGQLTWLEDLKAHGEKPDEKLGQKMLEGRTVDGFVARQGKFAYTIWIDPQTKELVQVEHEMFVKGSTITKIVMTGFRFDEPLDESLFSFEIPEGYQRHQQPALPKAVSGEHSIVEALRGFTQRSKGKFPKSITEWGEWAVLFSGDNQNGDLSEESAAVMGHLGGALPFLLNLPKDDYQYVGNGKSVTDKRCIVFWYKTAEGTLRAIFNDLSVADVEKQDLP